MIWCVGAAGALEYARDYCMFAVLKLLLDPKLNSQLTTNACHPQVKFDYIVF